MNRLDFLFEYRNYLQTRICEFEENSDFRALYYRQELFDTENEIDNIIRIEDSLYEE